MGTLAGRTVTFMAAGAVFMVRRATMTAGPAGFMARFMVDRRGDGRAVHQVRRLVVAFMAAGIRLGTADLTEAGL
ncbi:MULTISPECIES: hypothetical protein [Acidiphilium]|uniref:hypothetical protein n=1 Tax=Acidiphilium TaxID=522 RepID=UPI00257BE73A|nr:MULTISPECIES: hypothetical protein [Acidiphilium]HQT86767.1 hypothetical protein [Acidiphilium rubrum]